MKTLLTILLLSVCSIAFGQPSQKPKEASTTKPDLAKYDSTLHKKIVLSVYEKAKIDANNNMEEEVQKFREYYNKFLQELLIANKIPLDRISPKADSLQFTSNEILIILKKPKTK